MQNNHEKANRPRKAAKGKGYYIALALCVAAVGVSGYVFIRTLTQHRSDVQAAQAALSVPVVIDQLPEEEPEANETPATPGEARAEAHAPVLQAKPAAVEAVSIIGELDGALPSDVPESAPTADLWPVSGLVSAGYSMTALVFNETMGDWRVHEGVDILAQAGTDVRCAAAGLVTAVYEDEWKGTVVTVRHEDGYETVYANLAPEAAVSAGDTVEAGTILGQVGSTALSESAQPPHLHLEVYCDGELVDPETYLP